VGVILDSSVLVAAERGRLSGADIARAAPGAAFYVAPPVVAEVAYGVHRAETPARKAARAAFLSRVKSIPCLRIDGAVGEVFAGVAASLDARGRPAAHRANDLWIAALALRHGMGVMTLNAKDFADIPGLEVLVPEAE
jgi:tRNA(fMet)-specific endonuclease VapC